MKYAELKNSDTKLSMLYALRAGVGGLGVVFMGAAAVSYAGPLVEFSINQGVKSSTMIVLAKKQKTQQRFHTLGLE